MLQVLLVSRSMLGRLMGVYLVGRLDAIGARGLDGRISLQCAYIRQEKDGRKRTASTDGFL